LSFSFYYWFGREKWEEESRSFCGFFYSCFATAEAEKRRREKKVSAIFVAWPKGKNRENKMMRELKRSSWVVVEEDAAKREWAWGKKKKKKVCVNWGVLFSFYRIYGWLGYIWVKFDPTLEEAGVGSKLDESLQIGEWGSCTWRWVITAKG
jgi:hypothetical protein